MQLLHIFQYNNQYHNISFKMISIITDHAPILVFANQYQHFSKSALDAYVLMPFFQTFWKEISSFM